LPKKLSSNTCKKPGLRYFFAFFCFAFYTPFRTVKSAFSYSHFIHRPIRTFAFRILYVPSVKAQTTLLRFAVDLLYKNLFNNLHNFLIFRLIAPCINYTESPQQIEVTEFMLLRAASVCCSSTQSVTRPPVAMSLDDMTVLMLKAISLNLSN